MVLYECLPVWTLKDEAFKDHCILRDVPVFFPWKSRWVRNEDGYSFGIFSLSHIACLAMCTALSSQWVIHHDTETGQMFRWLNTNVLICEAAAVIFVNGTTEYDMTTRIHFFRPSRCFLTDTDERYCKYYVLMILLYCTESVFCWISNSESWVVKYHLHASF